MLRPLRLGKVPRKISHWDLQWGAMGTTIHLTQHIAARKGNEMYASQQVSQEARVMRDALARYAAITCGSDRVVAEQLAVQVPDDFVGIQNSQALIEAAPGMLRTLELLLGSLKFEQHMYGNADARRSTVDFPCAIEMCERAIAKAA